MLEIYFAPSFERILKKLDPHIKSWVKDVVSKVIDFYAADRKSEGLGVKRLRGNICEARAGLKIRVLYDLSGSRLTFILAGSHDDVKRFLKG